MSALRRILVAVADPRSRKQPALVKALRLARQSGARLELFHSLFDPLLQGERVYGKRWSSHEFDALLQSSRQQLEKRAAELANGGTRVECSVQWDYPPQEAIVRQALRSKADLVIASTHSRRRIARLLLTNTDWELIRLCPTPLILVKNARDWKGGSILAAIDPLHLHARPAGLDKRILKMATLLSRTVNAQLHAVHAHAPPITYVPGFVTGPVAVHMSGTESRKYLQQLRRRVIAETKGFSIGQRRVHLVEGDPAVALPVQARRTRARMVVMGAVSRSGLQRLFIGSTAERVIDQLDCDICFVKPERFRTTVRARTPHLPVMIPPM